MRVLVAGRNAKLLATTAGAFSHDLTIETAATKAACIALLERTEFDLVIACETLGDGSGLEVLSHAAVHTPNALRIFAARPATLNLLKGELGLFGLFRTLPYPISFRKLWAALDLARSSCADTEPQIGAHTPGVQQNGAAANRRTVANGAGAAGARTGAAVADTGATAHVAGQSHDEVQVRQVLRARPGATAQRAPRPITAVGRARNTAAANTNTTVARAAGPSRRAQSHQATQSRSAPTAQRTANAATARPTAAASSRTTVAHAAGPSRQAQPHQAARLRSVPTAQGTANAAVATARSTAAANSSTVAHAGGPSRQAQHRQAAQTPRSTPSAQRAANTAQATARATAATNNGSVASAAGAAASRRVAPIPQSEAFKRALAKRNAAKLEANSPMSAVDVLGASGQSYEAGGRGGRREPAMSNDSLAQLARLSLTRRPRHDSRGIPGAKKRAAIFVGSGVFAAATAAVLTFFMLNANNSIGSSQLPLVASIERPVPQKAFPWQPASQQPTGTMPLRSEVTATKAADLEVQAEAESDASAVEPGHPGPPPPNPPPPPYEPPSADSPGWVDE